MRLVVRAALLVGLSCRAALAADPAALCAIASSSPWTLRELETQHVPIVSYDPDTGTAYVVATPGDQRRLAAAGFALATVEPDVDARRQRLAAARALGAYHTYDETVAEVESLAAQYPAICRLETLGQSVEGRPLLGLKISDEPAIDDPTEPDVLFVGCHHAREFMSVEVPLDLAHTLLEGYGVRPQITGLVDSREVWIVPLLNPDGHVFQEEYAASPAWSPPGWRKNRRPNPDGTFGIDPNRNYSFQWAYDDEGSSAEGTDETYRGPAPFSEPETQAMRRLVERQRFVVAVSFHSFGGLLLYPWGYTRDTLTDDQPVFAVLADSMVGSNGYRPGNAYFGTIYKTNGEFCDYLYGELSLQKPQQTFAFTFELNTGGEGGFWPDETRIAPTCAALRPAHLFAIAAAGGVRGPLAPPQPLLVAQQDSQDRRRIQLDWTQPVDAENPVDHYEVFEILSAPVGTAAPVICAAGARTVLGSGIPRPGSGHVVLHVDAQLEPLWDYAYVEARGRDGAWHALRGTATTNASPTGRNSGNGWTGHVIDRRLGFDIDAIQGDHFDLALRLDAAPTAPRPPYVEARLDLAATFLEERNVIDPHVTGTHYTVVSNRGGIVGFGVTAVDVQGQRTDSEIRFFALPVTAVSLQDVEVVAEGQTIEARWHPASGEAQIEAWVRAVRAGDAVASVPEAPVADGFARAATVAGTDGALRFEAAPGRWRVLLCGVDAEGSRWFGPWDIDVQSATRFVAVANPWQGSGTIRFAVANAGPTRVEICRADGRLVRVLSRGEQTAGTHAVAWDATDGQGRRVAPGVYFVRLMHAGRVTARRLVLLR